MKKIMGDFECLSDGGRTEKVRRSDGRSF